MLPFAASAHDGAPSGALNVYESYGLQTLRPDGTKESRSSTTFAGHSDSTYYHAPLQGIREAGSG
jgi:hypothetical protein